MNPPVLITREILLIDDDIEERELFVDALANIDKKIECTQVKSLAEAMDYLQENVPDLIFIDFNMPVTNGLDVLTELRKLARIKNTRIIMYSNYISEPIQMQAMNLGATDCMKKPNTILVLVQKLRKILKNSNSNSRS